MSDLTSQGYGLFEGHSFDTAWTGLDMVRVAHVTWLGYREHMAHVVENTTEALPLRGAALSYGEKITVGGIELVPVALSTQFFGEGHGPDGSGEGSGGGGVSIPVGAYVADDDGLKFRPNLIALIAVAIPAICTSGWALSKIIKALKK